MWNKKGSYEWALKKAIDGYKVARENTIEGFFVYFYHGKGEFYKHCPCGKKICEKDSKFIFWQQDIDANDWKIIGKIK